jgi:hypothetical protein
VLGENEDMAEKVMDTVTLTLCENCANKPVIIPMHCDNGSEENNADTPGE